MLRSLNRVIEGAEVAIYAALAIVLFAAAGAALAAGGYGLVDGLSDDEGTKHAIEKALDALLLTFILVELLAAVRATLAERSPLVAEPFLLVGIIAGIKELVVITAFERDDVSAGDLALQVGTLAGVVLALAVAALLVRRKEREPEEGDADLAVGDGGSVASPAPNN